MKKIFLFLFFLFPFFSFCESSVTVTIVTQANTRVFGPTISSVPCTITVNLPSGNYSYIDAGLSGIFSTATVSGPYTVTDPDVPYNENYRLNTYCDVGGLPVVFTLTYGSTDPDPENPVNPESPNQAPASESTLSALSSNFRTFSQAFADWASALMGDVRAGNLKSDSIIGLLSAINSQQINDFDHRNLLHDDMKSFLVPLRDNVSSIKTGVDGLNTKSSAILTAQNVGNSYLASIDGYSAQIYNKTGSIDNKLSTANNTLTSIKNSVQPQGISSPTVSQTLTSLPSGSAFINTVKSRLLPGYSFFSPSGDSWPAWTFTFSLSSFGLEDLTVTLGGSDWQSAAGGKIVWMASIIRTLSKFAFYLIFLNAVIRALRQW